MPNYYELDAFQVRTPTDIIGQHIHLPKWDLSATDGSGNGWNYAFYKDAHLDDVLDKIDSTVDLTQRKAYVFEAQKIIMEQALVLPLTIESNDAVLWMEGREPAAPHQGFEESMSAAPVRDINGIGGYTGCTTSRKNALVTAHANAVRQRLATGR